MYLKIKIVNIFKWDQNSCLSIVIQKDVGFWFGTFWESFSRKLSTSIYDLVLLYVCHFHHYLIVSQIWPLSRYSCCYLGSLHPRNFFFHSFFKKSTVQKTEKMSSWIYLAIFYVKFWVILKSPISCSTYTFSNKESTVGMLLLQIEMMKVSRILFARKLSSYPAWSWILPFILHF